jgi:hypothetical protein
MVIDCSNDQRTPRVIYRNGTTFKRQQTDARLSSCGFNQSTAERVCWYACSVEIVPRRKSGPRRIGCNRFDGCRAAVDQVESRSSRGCCCCHCNSTSLHTVCSMCRRRRNLYFFPSPPELFSIVLVRWGHCDRTESARPIASIRDCDKRLSSVALDVDTRPWTSTRGRKTSHIVPYRACQPCHACLPDVRPPRSS